jgi:TRAP-type mannitol/chloroaromatic compound transport system substrate-binding protein
MRRRDLVKLGSLAALGAAFTGCGSEPAQAVAGAEAPRAGKRYHWRLGMIVPKTFQLWAPAVETFAAEVLALSGGRLNIEVHGAGELVGALEVFDAVKDGTLEMGHSAAYYWEGKVPGASFFTSVPFGLTASGMTAWLTAGGGQELWDELYAPYGLKALPCGNTGIQAGGWFNKPIRTIDDFNGLKMRMPGLGGKVISKVGASAMNMAGDELYTALERGVIDATEWIGPYHDTLRGFPKIAKYYYTCGWHEPGSTLELLINKDAWDSLDDELRLIVTVCASHVDRMMYGQWMAKDAEAFAKLRGQEGLEVAPYPREVLEALRPLATEVLNEVRGATPMAGKIHDAYFAFQKQFYAYQAAGEWPYVRMFEG